MKEEKKNSGFLINFYKKYIQKDEENAQEQSKGQDDGDELDNSLFQVRPPSIEEEAETLAKKMEEKQYLESLFELFFHLKPNKGGDSQIIDLLSFERWVHFPIKELPSYQAIHTEITQFLKLVCSEAGDILLSILNYETTEIPEAREGEVESAPPEPPVIDSAIKICMTKDKMCALLICIPPYGGGKEFTVDDIRFVLDTSGVVFGIDDNQIQNIVSGRRYMQLFAIAHGTLPVNGKDGVIIDQINYSSEIDIQEDETGRADFKNLNLIQSVLQDQVICDIIPPEKGTPGTDIIGKETPAKDGKPASIPRGKNTIVSEDGTKLISAIDGQIILQNGRFNVAQTLIIRENVDYGVGNIDFLGDVVVNGDVCTGFTVKAEGNVTVKGMVEGADITAGGDIVIAKGMNGNHNGTLDAKGMVKSSFLENCKVNAGGSVYANSIVSCEICCEDSVYVQGNKGVIIGGSITAYRSVEARIIGSKSRRETVIILGEIPQLYTKRTAAQEELKEIINILIKLEKNIGYMDKLKEALPPDKLKILKDLKQQQALYMQKKEEIQETVKKLSQVNSEYDECRVKSNMIFPVTKVSIGPDNLSITSISSRCNIFYSPDGVKLGVM